MAAIWSPLPRLICLQLSSVPEGNARSVTLRPHLSAQKRSATPKSTSSSSKKHIRTQEYSAEYEKIVPF